MRTSNSLLRDSVRIYDSCFHDVVTYWMLNRTYRLMDTLCVYIGSQTY